MSVNSSSKVKEIAITKNNKFKVTILSLSLVTILAGAAVSPALGAIGVYFSNASSLMIGLILSLPALFIAITSMLSSSIFKHMGVKMTGLLGMMLYLIGGLCGALSNNIYMLLVFRSILGIGTGILLPLSTGLIAYYYTPSEQKKMMGYSASCNNLGGIIAMLCSGFLLSISWRMAFLVYLVGIIPLFLSLIYLPNDKIGSKKQESQLEILKAILPYSICIFLTMLTFYIYISNFSMITIQENTINPSLIGIIMSGNSLIAFSIGIVFGNILEIFKSKTKYIIVISFSLAFLILSTQDGFYMMFIASALIGIGNGTIFPLINLNIGYNIPKEKIATAMSLNGFFIYMGQFFSPIIVNLFSNSSNSIRFPFYFGAVLCIILFIVFSKINLDVEKN